MKYILLCALLLVTFGYGVYQWRTIQRSIGISSRLMNEARAFERHPEIPRSHILVAGDSTAVGVGSSSEFSIAGRIGKDSPDADITNIGINGQRLQGLIESLETQKGKYFELVVLQIGANDVTGRTSYSDIEGRLAQVLTDARLLAPKVIVMTSGDVGLAPVFKWPVSAYLSARSRAVRDIFIEETKKHGGATYVDLYKEKKDDVFLTDIPRYYAPDHFHPSGDGYGVWYSQFPKLTI